MVSEELRLTPHFFERNLPARSRKRRSGIFGIPHCFHGAEFQLSGEIRPQRDWFPAVNLFGEMLEFYAGAPKSVRAENEMQGWFLGLYGFDDCASRSNRIARLLPGDFTEIVNSLSACFGVGGDRAGSSAHGVRGEEVGAQRARLDQCDPDAERPYFLGQAFGQAFQRKLRRGINSGAWQRGQPGDGGYVDDMSAALRAKEGKRGLDHLERSKKIDLENTADFRGGGFLYRPKQSITGIIDHYI